MLIKHRYSLKLLLLLLLILVVVVVVVIVVVVVVVVVVLLLLVLLLLLLLFYYHYYLPPLCRAFRILYPKRTKFCRVYSFVAIPYLQFMLHIMFFPMLNIFAVLHQYFPTVFVHCLLQLCFVALAS